ncbi:ComEC/Rec2 family competence protein [Flavihumibacter sp. CACIAM 22H1]|uniref:ComEC/Rec2 family competence protein n=1 Tax=Flavihumibacter sp. CACIAM 22H1 TaxID=1812911 RepID=UPI0007A7C450|nr:ComEC/Rec2 family competence protein [Flavihumibacter sp. CACIAM 22H1]KYP14793.1 MAG: hypothetical protein A1D16_06420 [Flavihumibacter sp. CACIAM 22H1]
MQKTAHPWIAAPFVRLVIPFCAGVLTAPHAAQIGLQTGGIILLILLGTATGLHIMIKKQVQSAPSLFGTCLYLLLFCMGLLLALQQDQRRQPHWFGHQAKDILLLVAQPEALPSLGAKSARFTMQVKSQVLKNGQLHFASGKFLLYTPLNQAASLQPGYLYLLPAKRLKALISPGNPGSFDFAAFNRKKNIFHQLYLDSSQLIEYPPFTTNSIIHWRTKAKLAALNAMDKTIQQPYNQLAKALLIGYREELDDDLLNTYSQTGVIHVIAVSGMHLGLIFLLLQKVLVFPETRFPAFKWIKFLLVICLTWFFAAITGSAGSIIRAATMFSFILFAKLIRKPVVILQSISLTAFLLLLLNPYWIWDTGFLLSFAALISIVLYQPKIAALAEPAHPLLKLIWELIAVTLAAQVLTLPLCIAFFHQAPVYFLPANLVAVPLSSCALIGALILWISQLIGISLPLIGLLTSCLLSWMNQGIAHISQLPGAVVEEINWTIPQVLSAYLILFLFSGWLKKPSFRLLCFGLVACLLFVALEASRQYRQQKQEVLLIYHLPGKSITTVISGRKSYFYLNRYSPASHPALQSGLRYFGCEESSYSTQTVFNWQHQLVGVPANQQELGAILALRPTYLVLTKQVNSLQPLLISPKKSPFVLLDGSIPEKRANTWSGLLQASGIGVHNTWQNGAFCQPSRP